MDTLLEVLNSDLIINPDLRLPENTEKFLEIEVGFCRLHFVTPETEPLTVLVVNKNPNTYT